jgi:hypothetical protein
VIGTNASPDAPGTASIHFHHASGRMGGIPGMWGYIKGGMGLVSFILCRVVSIAICPPNMVSILAPMVPKSDRERTVTPRTTPSDWTIR